MKVRIDQNRFIFPLHGQVDWALGNNAHFIKLVLPKVPHFRIKNIYFESIDKVMPNLSFKANANQNDLGFVELNEVYPSCYFHYDGSKVVGARKLYLKPQLPTRLLLLLMMVERRHYLLKKD